jgi:hypothetical protein
VFENFRSNCLIIIVKMPRGKGKRKTGLKRPPIAPAPDTESEEESTTPIINEVRIKQEMMTDEDGRMMEAMVFEHGDPNACDVIVKPSKRGRKPKAGGSKDKKSCLGSSSLSSTPKPKIEISQMSEYMDMDIDTCAQDPYADLQNASPTSDDFIESFQRPKTATQTPKIEAICKIMIIHYMLI